MLIINYFKLNKNSFSKRINVSSSAVIENIVAGRKSKPSFEILSKILFAFENINADWLITGRGEMLNKKENKVENKPDLVTEVEEKYYNCENCKHKQQIINTQNQRIEDLNKLLDSKDEIIEMLKSSLK
jgi:phage repressor protein C with HTH and peptisase S24 domain